jgi:urease accessory protein
MPLIMITRRALKSGTASESLVLPFDMRSRSRFRARLMSGEEVGVMLERGHVLRGGDLLLAQDGRVVEVGAAQESVTTLRSDDAGQLARAAYHLGNRHVALQVGDGWLRYRHDHVLDDMARGLGLLVTVEQAPFEPEHGAYQASGAAVHGHSRSHDHGHGNDQSHGHGNDQSHGHGNDQSHDHDQNYGHSHDHGHDH